MIADIEYKREATADLCRKYGVASLYVFGSVLREDFSPCKSDVDFLVEFGPMDEHFTAHAYFDMLRDLRKLLPEHPGRPLGSRTRVHHHWGSG